MSTDKGSAVVSAKGAARWAAGHPWIYRGRIVDAAAWRDGIPATAWRVVHAGADGLPSLVVDRYGPYVVAQLLSAGLEPGGVLFTSSCSCHVHRADFLEMLGAASRDSGRRLELMRVTGASGDHPELLNIPEAGYLKGALVRAVD